MMLCLAASYILSLTPSTTVTSSFFAGAEMITFFTEPRRCFGGVLGIGEFARRFNDDLGAQRRPIDLGRIFRRENFELLAVNDDRVAVGFHVGAQRAEDRVVLQQVSQRLGVGQVVGGDKFDVGASERGANDIATDTAEAVDANFHGHR